MEIVARHATGLPFRAGALERLSVTDSCHDGAVMVGHYTLCPVPDTGTNRHAAKGTTAKIKKGHSQNRPLKKCGAGGNDLFAMRLSGFRKLLWGDAYRPQR